MLVQTENKNSLEISAGAILRSILGSGLSCHPSGTRWMFSRIYNVIKSFAVVQTLLRRRLLFSNFFSKNVLYFYYVPEILSYCFFNLIAASRKKHKKAMQNAYNGSFSGRQKMRHHLPYWIVYKNNDFHLQIKYRSWESTSASIKFFDRKQRFIAPFTCQESKITELLLESQRSVSQSFESTIRIYFMHPSSKLNFYISKFHV